MFAFVIPSRGETSSLATPGPTHHSLSTREARHSGAELAPMEVASHEVESHHVLRSSWVEPKHVWSLGTHGIN